MIKGGLLAQRRLPLPISRNEHRLNVFTPSVWAASNKRLQGSREWGKRSHESLRWHWQRDNTDAVGERDSAEPGGHHSNKTITAHILLVLMILTACYHLETRELPAIGTTDTRYLPGARKPKPKRITHSWNHYINIIEAWFVITNLTELEILVYLKKWRHKRNFNPFSFWKGQWKCGRVHF